MYHNHSPPYTVPTTYPQVHSTSSMMILADSDPAEFLHQLLGVNHHLSFSPAGPHLLSRLRENGGGHGFRRHGFHRALTASTEAPEGRMLTPGYDSGDEVSDHLNMDLYEHTCLEVKLDDFYGDWCIHTNHGLYFEVGYMAALFFVISEATHKYTSLPLPNLKPPAPPHPRLTITSRRRQPFPRF